jgi:energy-coupling factor transporter ATP-binding protein EcfA2
MTKNTKDRKRSDNKHILIIGDSGSGKTTLLDSFPKPLFVADFDNGLDVLAGKDVTYEEYFDAPDKPEAWIRFMADLKRWHKEGPPGKTIAVDTLTSAADCALRNQLKVVGRGTGNIQQGDWGKAISDVKDALGFLSTLPCNVVVNTHFRMLQDEMSMMHYVPLLYGKDLPSKVYTYFQDVWRTFVDLKIGKDGKPTVAYQLQMLPSTKYDKLKNSLGLKEMFVEPNFTKLLGGDDA